MKFLPPYNIKILNYHVCTVHCTVLSTLQTIVQYSIINIVHIALQYIFFVVLNKVFLIIDTYLPERISRIKFYLVILKLLNNSKKCVFLIEISKLLPYIL